MKRLALLMVTVASLINDVALAEEKLSSLKTLIDNTTISGLVEVEGSASRDFEKKDSSDVTLATMQLGIDTQVDSWASGHMILLYEEDDTEPMDVDEATITVGGGDASTLFLTAGKFYVPFGVFESNMISDPLTLELGETGQSALQVGYDRDGWLASAYVFNCDVDEVNETDDHLACYGASGGYTYESEDWSGRIHASYMSNLLDTDLLEGEFVDSQERSITDMTGGWGLYASTAVDAFTLRGEYVSAVDQLEFTDGVIDEPSAWNVEFDVAIPLFGYEGIVGFAWQGSDNLAGVLPEQRLLGTVGIGLSQYVTVALEYAHDWDYKPSKGGTDESAHTVTGQVALQF